MASAMASFAPACSAELADIELKEYKPDFPSMVSGSVYSLCSIYTCVLIVASPHITSHTCNHSIIQIHAILNAVYSHVVLGNRLLS